MEGVGKVKEMIVKNRGDEGAGGLWRGRISGRSLDACIPATNKEEHRSQ